MRSGTQCAFAVIFLLLLSLSASITPNHVLQAVTAASPSVSNIVVNPSFENGLDPTTNQPKGWTFSTYEGVENATVSLDSSLQVDGSTSAKVFVGPIVCPIACPDRPIAFAQFYQSLPNTLRFANLTDATNALSFWWYFHPYPGDAAGDFRIRLISAEGIAELDYVFDADPAVSYQNQTGSKYILLANYAPDQWHHVSRDLKRDWVNAGFSLSVVFSRIQFEGLVFQPPLRSETFWVDAVEVLAGSVPLGSQPPKVTFDFQPASPATGENVLFRATASDPNPGGFITSYAWDFGDRSPPVVGSNSTVYHAFNQPGTYAVSVVVTDNFGLYNGISRSVLVKLKPACTECPIANITATPHDTLVGRSINFDGSKSRDPKNLTLIFRWDFGDGANSNDVKVAHAYSSAGVYLVELTVTNSGGLTGTNVTTVSIGKMGVGVTTAKLAHQVMLIEGISNQTISLSLVNTGNNKLYVYVSFTIIFSNNSEKTLVGQPRLLVVRGTTDISITFSPPSEPGRYLVLGSVFVSPTPAAVGSPSWIASERVAMVFRVI